MQRHPSLPWDDVRLFLALGRARTVGEAARSLGVDASTVSRRLVALEQALGTTLFDRGRDGVEPTEAAERLMPVAEVIEESMSRFALEADGLERSPSGLVRIACPPDVAEVVVAPLLPELCRRYPALRVEIDPGEAVVDLTRREADLALRTVRPERGDLVTTRLAITRWVLATAAKRARALGTLRAWADAPWIAFGERLAGTPPARWLATHAPDVDPVVRTDSLMLQLALAARGVGVALVPEASAAHYGLALVAVGKRLAPAAAGWPSVDLFLVTHRALRHVPRVRAVWDLLVERAPSNVPA